MKEVPLTKGLSAIVDDADFDVVSRYKWCYWGKYAARAVPGGSRRTRQSMHELLMRPPEGMQVDHINRNKLDNRRSNLRACTVSQNQANRDCRAASSGFMGVTTDRRLWKAHVMLNGKTHNLGRYATAKEAAIVRDAAAMHLFGEFANLNFPDIGTKPHLAEKDPHRRLNALKKRVSCSTCGKEYSVAGMGQHSAACAA